MLFEIPSLVSSWDLGCLHSLPSLFANPAMEGVSLYHQRHHLRNNFCGYEVAGQTTVRKMFFLLQPEEEPKEEAAPAKPVVGIIYPPPEVRNIVDKTASFVAR